MTNLYSKSVDYITSFDKVSKPASERLNYNKNKGMKTFFGGLATYMVFIYIAYVGTVKAYDIYVRKQPYINS